MIAVPLGNRAMEIAISMAASCWSCTTIWSNKLVPTPTYFPASVGDKPSRTCGCTRGPREGRVVDGYIWLNRDAIPHFAGDLSESQQDLIYATQGPANAALFEAKVDVPAWKTKPSWYVVAQKDGTINPEQERFMSKRMGATTVEVSSSHVPMLSHPDVVVDLIKKASEASTR
jgi:pimeloyl-ACP methyl ester carboxylesterase